MDLVFSSRTAETFVYANPPIVIKIFFAWGYECYDREKKAYEKLAGIQGSFFPILYGSGVCVEDGRPFVVLSNEGEGVDKVTEYDK